MKIAILILFYLAALFAAYSLHLVNKEREVEEVKPVAAEWCFLKTMPYGQHMSIVETEGGNYQYQLFAAKDGVEVWVPCKE